MSKKIRERESQTDDLPADWPSSPATQLALEVREPAVAVSWPSNLRPDAQIEGLLFARRIAQEVETHVQGLAYRYLAQGRSLVELGSPHEVADRLLAALPTPSLWDQHVGPFYGSAQIAKVLGNVSRQTIAERRARRTLIALRTADGHWVYPTFQFDEHRLVLAGLGEIWQRLGESGVDDWTLAGWLVASQRALDGEAPVSWLRQGRPIETLRALARQAADRMAQ